MLHNSNTKICTKCGNEKEANLDNFHYKEKGRLQLHSICKPCRAKQSLQWNKNNHARYKEIQKTAKRKIRETADGRLKLSEINKKYYNNNKDKVNLYYKNKRLNDDLFCLKCRYRGLIAKAVYRKNFTKRSKSNEVLGCDWPTFKRHIERQFHNGMSWDNFNKIHIDHIIPLATAETEDDVIRLNHFTNLRPLWAKDNIEKRDKILTLI